MSCSSFCGYHDDVSGAQYYGVIPYPNCTGCDNAGSVFDSLTMITSHELAEAITDPVPGAGGTTISSEKLAILQRRAQDDRAYTVQKSGRPAQIAVFREGEMVGELVGDDDQSPPWAMNSRPMVLCWRRTANRRRVRGPRSCYGEI